MLPPIASVLRSVPAIVAIVGNRVYRHDSAPQDTSKPYITWFFVSDIPANNLSDLPPMDQWTVQIDCWHQTDAGIETLARLVRNAMEPLAHMTNMPINTSERETKLYRIALQFDVFLERVD